MRKYFGTVVDTAGNVQSGASVTVYIAGTTTSASLYSDNGITAISNPVTTNSRGGFSFYVADGTYDLTVSGSNLTTYTIEDIVIRDPVGLTEAQTLTNKTLTSPIIKWASASKTSAYSALASDFILHCDASAGAFTITLPQASGVTGLILAIGKSDSSDYAVLIDGYSTETIGGVASIYLYMQHDYILIQSDGSNWNMLSKTWEEIIYAFTKTGDLTATTTISPSWIFTYLKGRVISAYVYVRTAPTGADLIFDINKNGTTLYTTQANRPTIVIDSTKVAASVPDVVALAQDDRLDLDCDQIGSETAGADATILINVRVQGRYLS